MEVDEIEREREGAKKLIDIISYTNIRDMSDGRIVCVFLLALPIIIQYFSRTSTCLYLLPS